MKPSKEPKVPEPCLKGTFRMKAAEIIARIRARSINQHAVHCHADCEPFLQFSGGMMDNITRPCIIMDYHWAWSSAELKTISARHQRSAVFMAKTLISEKNSRSRSLRVQSSSRQTASKKFCSVTARVNQPRESFSKPSRIRNQAWGLCSHCTPTADGRFLRWKEQSRAKNAKSRRKAVQSFFSYFLSLVYPSNAVISFCIPPFADTAECR